VSSNDSLLFHGRTKGLAESLFRTDCENLFALNLDFDAEGRANIAALYSPSADPDVSGKAGGFQRVVECTTAGIADKGVNRSAKIVVLAKFFEIRDVFELAGTVGRFSGEGPIARGRGRRSAGKADNRGGNVFAGEIVANEKVDGRPGLGKIGNLGDRGVGFRGVSKSGRWVRSR